MPKKTGIAIINDAPEKAAFRDRNDDAAQIE